MLGSGSDMNGAYSRRAPCPVRFRGRVARPMLRCMSAMPATTPFPHLFSPLRLGSITLRNRIFSSGHDTVMAEDGHVTDQLVAYHEARAAGGVGLIVVQATAVHPSADYTAHALAIYDDAMIPGFRRLAAAVHAHGVPIIGQLFHGGREVMETRDGTQAVALAPSVVPTERFHTMPRAMTVGQIAEIVAAYGSAAARFAAAGFEGAEIVGSHGYLPAQFLNPRTNLRGDGYGGDPERRLRFLREVIAAVREASDPGFVLGLRISIEEITPEGLTADDVLPALAALDAAGGLDYVSVVAGTSATLAGSDHIVPPMTQPNAYTATLAARAKAVVRIPVLVAGRINQPQEAETVLAAGQADACAMTRALISDPELPNKAAAGRLDEIRACVGCNQACIGHFHAGYPISCIQYPESGREREFGRLAAADSPRDVMVVGGGPGGLKAAAVAAARGHRVTLYEAGRRVGGQVLLAEMLPGRAEFGGVITNLAGEARAGRRQDRHPRRRRCGPGAPGSTGRARGRDRGRGRGGRRSSCSTIPSSSTPGRSSGVLPSRPAAWSSPTGAATGWGSGSRSMLARSGHQVTLASTGYTAGFRLQQYVRDAMLVAVARARVELLPLTRLFGYDGSAVFLQHVLTGDAVVVEDVVALVLALGHEPVDDLLAPIDGFGGEVHAIGDCVAPRTVEEAVLDGLRVGAAI